MIVGYIDYIGARRVSGWVLDSDNRDRVVPVSLQINGVIVARTEATRPRADLDNSEQAGARGFLFDLPQAMSREVMNKESLSALADGDVPLAWSKRATGLAQCQPLKVFIVGAPRSGTSAMYTAMREVFDLPGRGESHLMPLVQRMVHVGRMYFKEIDERAQDQDILIKQLRRADLEEYLLSYFRDFYEKTYGGDSWVDKTPSTEAILGVHLIAQMYPDAKLIITRRTGIEVVHSHRIKFQAGFEDAAKIWAAAAAAIVKAQSVKMPVLNVDQFDLTNEPEVTAERISEFLGRPQSAKDLAKFFTEKRVDQLSNHDWTRRLTLDETGWSEEEKAIFRTRCGDMMEQLSYPM